MEALQQEKEHTIDIDGFIYDAETGECLGPVDKQEFHVTDESSANWVLEKILDCNAEINRNDIKRQAVLDNLAKLDKRAQAKKDWLTARFGGELEDFARKQLDGKKTKTLTLTFGELSFRTVKGGLKVKDEEKAIAWAKTKLIHGAIKTTEKILVSKIEPEDADLIKWNIEQGRAAAFEVTEDCETFTIKAGDTK